MSVEKCIQCGICKVNCPIFKVILKESVSPRGLTFLAKKEIPTPVYKFQPAQTTTEERQTHQSKRA